MATWMTERYARMESLQVACILLMEFAMGAMSMLDAVAALDVRESYALGTRIGSGVGGVSGLGTGYLLKGATQSANMSSNVTDASASTVKLHRVRRKPIKSMYASYSRYSTLAVR